MLTFVYSGAIYKVCCMKCLLEYGGLGCHCITGADPGFEKGGFNIVQKSDTGGATNTYL